MKQGRVERCLSGISYPASKEELINHAKNTCGDQEVVSMLKDLPDKSYGGAQVLTSELRSVLPTVSINL